MAGGFADEGVVGYVLPALDFCGYLWSESIIQLRGSESHSNMSHLPQSFLQASISPNVPASDFNVSTLLRVWSYGCILQ